MAANKRGSRRIVVDGVGYRWKFPRWRTDQEEDHPGVWAVAERVEPEGSQLLLVFPQRHHMSGPHAQQGRPVLPSDIAAGIRAALDAGWRSDRPGSQFRWRVAEQDAEPGAAADGPRL